MPFHVFSRTATMTFAGKVVRTLAVVATLSVVCASLMCTAITYAELTEDQKTNTRAFLDAFTPYSTDLQNAWTTAGDDLCSWKYVDCNSVYGVLFNMRQTSSLEGKLTQLPKLPEYADGSQVVFNTIMFVVESIAGLGTLPESWGRLSSLSIMVLGGNGITGSLPAAWGSLPKLSSLSLWGNKLTGTLPASWSGLPSISFISLNGNLLTGSIPEEWTLMPKLTWGDSTINDLCGCLPSAWVGKSGLKVDAAVKASDCATANGCPVSSSDSSSTQLFSSSSGFGSSSASFSQSLSSPSTSSSSSAHASASSRSSKTSSHAPAECAVSHCITCETDNANNCAQCAESYELTGNLQCALKESNGAGRVSWSVGCQWVALALMTLASATLFLF